MGSNNQIDEGGATASILDLWESGDEFGDALQAMTERSESEEKVNIVETVTEKLGEESQEWTHDIKALMRQNALMVEQKMIGELKSKLSELEKRLLVLEKSTGIVTEMSQDLKQDLNVES